jgi:hypothetical protein
VRCLLIRAIQICEGDESTLWLGQGRLANAYRARWGDNDSNTLEAPSDLMSLRTNSSPSVSVGLSRSRLEILAEEAARIQPFSDNDGDPYMGGARSIPEQAEQQLRAREEGPVAGQVPRLASNEMGFTPAATYGQDMEFAWQNYANHDPDAIQDAPAGPQASIATADQVQPNVSGSRAEISEQHLPGATPNMAASDQQLCLEPMQMLSDIGTSWPHGTIPPHPALNSVEDPIYGFHQDGMVTNQDLMMPGPDGHFWSLDWDDI